MRAAANLRIFFIVAFFFAGSSILFAESDTAIVIVDMQEGFLGDKDPEVVARLVKAHTQLLEWANSEGHAVVVFEYFGSGNTIDPLINLVRRSKRYAIFEKNKYSGFSKSPLGSSREGRAPWPEEILSDWNIKKVVIGGLNGKYCVKCSAQDALRHKFEVYTAADIVADFTNSKDSMYPDKRWWLFSDQFKPFESLGFLKDCAQLKRVGATHSGSGDQVLDSVNRLRLDRGY